MKSSECFCYSKNLVVILIFSFISSGHAQDFSVEQSPRETPQAVVETENQPSAPLLTPENSAIAAALADGLTTNLALSAGAVETNSLISSSPIGLVILTGMKIGLVKFSGTLSEPEKRSALKSSSALWGGAAINNVAVYFAMPPPVPVIAGILMGFATWFNMDDKYAEEDALLAARQVNSLNTEEKVADLRGENSP